jgi:hypothetical protein
MCQRWLEKFRKQRRMPSPIITPYSDKFPVAKYESVHQRMGPYQPQHAKLYQHYAGGWNAVRFRSIGCERCLTEYTRLFAQHGAAPVAHVHIAQENALYGFFSYAQSSIESWFFAMHAVASMDQPTSFPMATSADLRNVVPSAVLQRFTSTYPGSSISSAMKGVLTDRTYAEWKELRNVLVHRTAPGRHHFLPPRTTPPDADWVGMGLVLNQHTLSSRYPWLMSTVGTLVRASEDFTTQRF